MPVRHIMEDNWQPIYSLAEPDSFFAKHCPPVEFTDDEINKIRAAFLAFDDAQELIRDKFKRLSP